MEDSGWVMSWTINRQKHFLDQDASKNTVVWTYGLYTSRKGNYVKKPMKDCTGEEIAREWLYHSAFRKTELTAWRRRAAIASRS